MLLKLWAAVEIDLVQASVLTSASSLFLATPTIMKDQVRMPPMTPPPGGGPGTQGPKQRRTLPTANESAAKPNKQEDKLQVEPAYLHNLHQQIHFLELEVKCLRTAVTAPATSLGPAGAKAPDETARHERERLEELQERALQAALMEQHAQADTVQALEQLARQKDDFFSQCKKWQEETVGLQRELENSNLREKIGTTDLVEVTQELERLKFESGSVVAQASPCPQPTPRAVTVGVRSGSRREKGTYFVSDVAQRTWGVKVGRHRRAREAERCGRASG